MASSLNIVIYLLNCLLKTRLYFEYERGSEWHPENRGIEYFRSDHDLGSESLVMKHET